MKFADAIAAITGLDFKEKNEVLEAINSQVQEITHLEKVGQGLEDSMKAILEIAGATEGNISSKLETALKTLKDLKQNETNYQAQLTERDKVIQGLRTDSQITAAAQLLGANSNVLKTLMNTSQGTLEIKDDKVLFKPNEGEPTELKTYAETNWADFNASLFPSSTSAPLPVPSGGSQGKVPPPFDPMTNFLNANYGDLAKTLGGDK